MKTIRVLIEVSVTTEMPENYDLLLKDAKTFCKIKNNERCMMNASDFSNWKVVGTVDE